MTFDDIESLTLEQARRRLRQLRDAGVTVPSRVAEVSALRRQLLETLDSLPDLFFEVSEDGRYFDTHSQHAELLAAPAHELLGSTVRDKLPKDAADVCMAALAEARDHGASAGRQYSLDLPQGRRWFELSISRKQPVPGERARFVVLSRDVTERRLNEEALRESEDRFRMMAESAPAMIWVSSEDKGCTYFNQAWLSFTGRTLEQELGIGWSESVHPEDVKQVLDHYEAVADAQARFHMEYRIRRADGVYRWIEDTAIPRFGHGGRVLGYIGTCFDVTDRRATLEALRLSEERLRLVLRATNDAVWDYDVASNQTFLSPRWWSMLGHDMDEAHPKQAWHEWVHPDDLPGAIQSFVDAGNGTSEVVVCEYRLRHKLGHYVPVLSRGTIQRDANGMVTRITGSNADLTERKRSEEALRRSNALLRRMGALAHVGGWELDLPSGNVTWSDEVYRIHALNPDEPSNSELALSHYVGEARKTVTAAIRACSETGVPWDLELPMRTAAGRDVWVRSQGSGVTESGRVIRVVGAVQDVTEHKRATEAVRASEARLQALINAVPVPLALIDQAGRIYLMNAAFILTFGYTPEDIPSVSEWWPRAYPDAAYRAEVQSEWASRLTVAQQTGAPFEQMEAAVSCKDGRVRTILFNAVPFDVTGERLVLVVFNDVTDQRRSTKALLDFKSAFDEHAIVDMSDAHGRMTYANDKICAISKYSREELLGRDHRIFNSGHHSPEFFKTLWLTVSRGEVWKGEIKNRAKDGTTFWVDTTIVPFLDRDQHPVQYIAIRTDITERERTQRLMLRAQRMESIGTLAGGVAHDLNNALAPILMVTDLLRAEYPGASDMVDLVEASAKRGAGMVRQLLTFAKGVEGERVSVRPLTLVQEIEKIAGATFPKSIRVTTSHARDLPPVSGDPTQLHQVLLNLCVNARDAMPDGGTLTLSVDRATVVGPEHGAVPANPKPGEYVVWRVADTGAGIPPDVLERLFEPFFSTKGPDRGTGLGLSTVMGIVKSHGGFTRVDSTVGQGSVFSVFLPAVLPTEPVSTGAAGRAHLFRGHGQRILVVDDEPSIRRSFRAVLGPLGFEVLAADGGADALEQLRNPERAVDAIITDIHMPKMNGIDFVREVRQSASSVPILCVSGQLSETDAAELRRLGVSGLLGKPFTRNMLLEAVQGLFPTG